jgi:drug/metabolite transporter (DMT)-like permease
VEYVARLDFTVRLAPPSCVIAILEGFFELTAKDSLRYLPLADATILNLLAPLGTSFLMSKELSSAQVSSAILCLAGVGLITKPSFLLDLFHHDQDSNLDSGVFTSHSSQTGFVFAVVGILGGVVRHHFLFNFNPPPEIVLTSYQSARTLPSRKLVLEPTLWCLQTALQWELCS